MGFYGQRLGSMVQAIVGDVGFDDSYVGNFWAAMAPMAVSYSPLSGSVLRKAQEQWQTLQDLIDLAAPSASKAKARLAQLREDLNERIDVTKQLRSSGSDFQRNPDFAAALVMQFTAINSLVQAFANESWPDVGDDIAAGQAATEAAAAAEAKRQADAAAAQAKVVADAASAKAKLEQTQTAIADAQAAIAAAARAKQVAQAAGVAHQQAQTAAIAKRAALKTPLTAVAIAVPLAIVAFFALRGRKKSVAGYKRRRR